MLASTRTLFRQAAEFRWTHFGIDYPRWRIRHQPEWDRDQVLATRSAAAAPSRGSRAHDGDRRPHSGTLGRNAGAPDGADPIIYRGNCETHTNRPLVVAERFSSASWWPVWATSAGLMPVGGLRGYSGLAYVQLPKRVHVRATLHRLRVRGVPADCETPSIVSSESTVLHPAGLRIAYRHAKRDGGAAARAGAPLPCACSQAMMLATRTAGKARSFRARPGAAPDGHL